MSHAVHYQDASGEMRLEDAASLEAAIERVEALQNTDGATRIRVFREVPIEVRTYYRVVAVAEDGPAAASPTPDATPAAEPVVERATTGPFTARDAGPDTPPPAAAQPPMEVPSGAMVMSRPPVAVAAEAPDAESSEPADTNAHDHRRLFTRSS